jgi:molecular chaperone GrpE
MRIRRDDVTEEKRESTRPNEAEAGSPTTGEHAIPDGAPNGPDDGAADEANTTEAESDAGAEPAGKAASEPPKNQPEPAKTSEIEAARNALAVELADLKAERDRLKDQLLRTAADFDNYRKRARRDLEDGDRRAREETLRELLPIIDNLERAVSAAETATSPIAVAEGVQMVLKQFHEVASRLSLRRLKVVGERFDPALHDAVQQLETDEHEAGTIVAEVTAGYRVGERLLRPALVVVARAFARPSEAPGPPAAAPEPDSEA